MGDLTASQRCAVLHHGGPLLVLAGPGSGKTRVITRRIAHRIFCGVPAWQIVALTFTNKAAAEMKSRVDALVPAHIPGRRGLVIGTFHSFCAGLLRRYGASSASAGIGGAPLAENFSIFDSDDARSVIKKAIASAGLESAQWPVAAVATEISCAKNKLQTAAQYSASAMDFRQRTMARLYDLYERAMVRENALDFDDLLLRTACMLQHDAAVSQELRERFSEVLVDEYQDTNHAQFTVAHAIAREHRNICVVGDPDQSIYAWRGADISNIQDFEQHYPGATVIALGENFRSTGHIVSLADKLIRNNESRRHKDLFTQLGLGDRPRVVRLMDEVSEAQFVADALQAAHRSGSEWRDMAVLYRMNALSRSMEDALRRRGIPYLIARGTAFYDRKEVRDTMGYLRALVNPVDDTSLRRIVNVPARGIGATTIGKLEQVAAQRRCSLAGAMACARQCGVSERTAKSIDGFLTLLVRYRSELDAKSAHNLGPFVARLITEAGLERAAIELADDDQDAMERKANVQEVANAAGAFELPESQPGIPDPTLGDALRGFLQSVALASDSDAIDPQKGVVTLMSLHAAKGLEFQTVAIIGIEEGLLPHSRSLASPKEVEEERRLFFVGITRCKRTLLLTSVAMRSTRGMRMSTIESGFLRELPQESLVYSDHTGGRSATAGGRHWTNQQRTDDAESTDEQGDGDVQYEVGGSRTQPACGMSVGTTVRHLQFGIGRIEAILPRGSMTSVRVHFRTAGVRVLVLEYAKLEIIAG